MIATIVLIPGLLVIVGLALVALAILAPPRDVVPRREPGRTGIQASPQRIRDLERFAQLQGPFERWEIALNDPSIEVAAVAAVLLRDAGRQDLVRASPRAEEVRKLIPLS